MLERNASIIVFLKLKKTKFASLRNTLFIFSVIREKYLQLYFAEMKSVKAPQRAHNSSKILCFNKYLSKYVSLIFPVCCNRNKMCPF